MHPALPFPEQAVPDNAAKCGCCQHLRLRVPVQLLLKGEEFRDRGGWVRGGTRWQGSVFPALEQMGKAVIVAGDFVMLVELIFGVVASSPFWVLLFSVAAVAFTPTIFNHGALTHRANARLVQPAVHVYVLIFNIGARRLMCTIGAVQEASGRAVVLPRRPI